MLIAINVGKHTMKQLLKQNWKKILVLYSVSLFLIYLILVIDNLDWSLSENNLNLFWIFTTEFTNWQDILTMIIFAFLFLLILKKKIKKEYIYPLGILFTYFILGFNKVLWNVEGVEWHQNMLSIFVWKENWITMLIGAFIFLLFYNKMKKRR